MPLGPSRMALFLVTEKVADGGLFLCFLKEVTYYP